MWGDCQDCGGGLDGREHEPWCMNDYVPARPTRRRPAPGARCFICRQRLTDCDCPDGTEPD